MSELKIIMKNTSDEVVRFLIFNERPACSYTVDEAWTNVWGRSPGVGKRRGTTEFKIKKQYYAVCGMATQPLSCDLVVSMSDNNPVKLAVNNNNNKGTIQKLDIMSDGVVFDEKAKSESLDKENSFGINTASYDMTKYKNAFCGLGMQSPTTSQETGVVPVSVWQAKPNQNYQITPRRKYYISIGSFVPGQLVDIRLLSQVATIDFTDRNETVATVTYTPDLYFLEPQYSFAPSLSTV